MDWKKEISKALLSIGISLLGKLIPALGGLLGGPLGWIAGWAIGKLSEMLYDWVERYLRYAGIDREIRGQLEQAIASRDELFGKMESGENLDEAIEKFRSATRDLGTIRLRG